MADLITFKDIEKEYKLSKTMLNKYKVPKQKIGRTFFYDKQAVIDLFNLLHDDNYISMDKAVNLYHISKNFLNTCRLQDKIQYIKVGNQYRYNNQQLPDIQRLYIEEQKQKKKNNAYSLIKQFYTENDLTCKNADFDLQRINRLLKKGYTANEIKIAMTMLLFTNQKSLYKIETIIDDALQEYQWYINRDKVDTIGYVVKQFYLITHKPFIRRNFYFQCLAIEELMKTNSADKIISTIVYMHDNKIDNFDYIQYNLNKANTEVEEDLLVYAMKKAIRPDDIAKAIKHFTYKTYYNKKLTKFEYAFLVNLPLNEELIKIGMLDKAKNPWAFEVDVVKYTSDELFAYLKKNGVDLSCL